MVVHQAEDLAFAQAMAGAALEQRRPGEPGPALLLQPGWDCPEGQRLAISFVQANPGWRLSLQSHKWLGVR